MNLLRLLLIALVVYIPNQAQFRIEFTVRGLNVLNVLVLLTVLLMLALPRSRGAGPAGAAGAMPEPPMPLRGVLLGLTAALVLAFLVGVAQDASQWVADLTALKIALTTLLLYPIVYHSVRDAQTVRLLVHVVLGVTLFAALLGLRQALDYGISTYNETRRVSAPFGWSFYDANRSAIFFVMFLPLLGAYALHGPGRRLLRLAALAGCGLCVFVVFFTYSRQAYAIVAVLTLLLVARRSWIAAVLVVLALAGFEHWAPQTVIERIQSTEKAEDDTPPPKPAAGASTGNDSMSEGRFDESTESRWIIWEGAAQLIAERPWGVGLNHFKREIGAHAPRYAGMDAHNSYVLITTEAGVLGLVALMATIVALWRLARRVDREAEDPFSRFLGWGFTLSIIALVLGNVYGSRFLDEGVMGNFWILAALVARHATLQDQALLGVRPAQPIGLPEASGVPPRAVPSGPAHRADRGCL
jgi:O-antigen ligase